MARRGSGPPEFRTFNKQVFKQDSIHARKVQAEFKARKVRSEGYNARVVSYMFITPYEKHKVRSWVVYSRRRKA